MKTFYVGFADCETNPFKKGVTVYKPFIWGVKTYFFNGRNFKEIGYKDFRLTNDFVNYAKKNLDFCYCHNGGKFDFLFLKEYLRGDILYINGRLSQFTIGKCCFRDSYLYFPLPLKSYKKDDFDYSLLDNPEKNIEKIKLYLEDDCKFLAEIMIKLINKLGFNLTIASACLKRWKKIENLPKKSYNTKSSNYDSIFRKFYFGGRVECFKTGKIEGNFKCFDINSAYPYAMLFNHPFGYEYYLSNTFESIKPYSFVECTGVALGCFPYRDDNGSIFFPRDRKIRKYYVTGSEYLTAIELNCFTGKIDNVYTHFQTRDFKRYINTVYEEKQKAEKKSSEYLIAKLEMNSLYGKFGQNPSKFKEYKILESQVISDIFLEDGKEWKLEEIIDANKFLVSRNAENENYLNVAISASITGFQRARLFKYIYNSDTPVYCDTDSIFCKDLNSSDLHPTKLGYWDIEGEFTKIFVFGKKLYCAYDKNGKLIKYASKGAKLGEEEFKELIKKGRVKFINDIPTFRSKGKNSCIFIDRNIKQNCFTNIENIKNFLDN